MSATPQSPLPTSEAQKISESIVGSVTWWNDGAQGNCQCPGAQHHSTNTSSTDCKVVCEAVAAGGGVLKPGVYCFHDSCRAVVETASFDLRSALGKRTPSTGARPRSSAPLPKRPDPVFDPAKLEKYAGRLPEAASDDFFATRSAKRVDNRTPASFLHELFQPNERVIVFDVFTSQGQHVWEHRGVPFNARELDGFRRGKPNGVWFLSNPVSGEWGKNDKGERSRRAWQQVVSWRYLVLESDAADPKHWLAALAQLPLPIAAIYASGGKSIHALLRLDADSKSEWDAKAAKLKVPLITLGADRKAISAVRLTRLPCCQRLGSTAKDGTYKPYPEPREQRLIYLNGNPAWTAICDLPAYA